MTATTTTIHATEQAQQVLHQLESKYGSLIICITAGCCDGTSPLCLPTEDYMVDENDILLGKIGSIPVYVARWQHGHLLQSDILIDCEPGNATGFSVEGGLGMRFVLHTKGL